MEKRHSTRPTDGFRSEHLKIQKHLSHIQTWSGDLRGQQPDEQLDTMRKIASFFAEHIRAHAAWEETSLYPLIDRLTNSANSNPFTSSMRHEHKIISRWIDELNEEAQSTRPDATAFARATDQLLGVIKAHFEEEEEVLLPLIDRAMTTQEFKEEMRAHPDH